MEHEENILVTNEYTDKIVEDQMDEDDKKLMQRIEDMMDSEKPYRDENFSLEIMADKLNIHRNVVSRVINRATGKGFKRFVNEYRISEAIYIISSSKETPCIESIMFEVGFRSRTPFFETFKSITGVTPSVFIRNRNPDI